MSAATNLRNAAEQIASDAPEVHKPASLAESLVCALKDLTVVELANTADMGTFKVRYASLPDIVKKTRPVLARNGLVALTPLCALGDQPAVSVVLVHESGESMSFGPFPFQHGRDAQATGSWVTYMRRYALVAALGMAAGDDDDGAEAQPRGTAVHPLRTKVQELKDGEKVWAHFLGKAGIEDGVADALLGSDKNWRDWLSAAIAAHEKPADLPPDPDTAA